MRPDPAAQSSRSQHRGDQGAPLSPTKGSRALPQPAPKPEVYACPICGGWPVFEEHGNFRCSRCGRIVESCCEGAPPPTPD